MNVEELKDKARRHEQREEWQKAFELYNTALRMQSEDESPDIALLNRVGDIQTRLGQLDGAAEQYERAIDLYLDAELPNNAIAICKKVLRNLPERNVFLLRMGQIRAGQGFLTDARQSFLTYAERQTAVGDIESALNALIEFVEISPEDVEIRQGLASQLEAHDRVEEAVEQLLEVHRHQALAGETDRAAGTAEKIRALDPDIVVPDVDELRSEDQPPEPQDLVLESTSLGGLELQDWDDEEEEEEDVQQELESLDEDSVASSPEAEAYDAAGSRIWPVGTGEDQTGSQKEGDEGESAAGFERGDEEDAGDEGESLPFIELGGEEEGEIIYGGPDAEDQEESEDFAVESLVGPSFRDVSGMGLDDDLPLLALDDEEEEELDGLEPTPEDEGVPASLESAMEDVAFEEAVEDREEPVREEEDREEPPRDEPPQEEEYREEPVQEEEYREEPLQEEEAGSLALEDPQAAADRGDLDLAMERVRTLMEEEPDSVELHQRLVEYAFRKNDQETLVSAYMSLAGCLARTGAPLKARAVCQQVLALSPDHSEAAAMMETLDGSGRTESPTQVASSEEYVDLGSLILGEEAEKTTRWTVAAEAPSGDDEADFAKMLSQFKEKVSENVASDDVSAHHDLGTAYMEMGLLDEAIGEFQMALRASPSHLPTHEVMGRCWMEMGKPDMAVRALDRALKVPYEVEDELIGIYYLMGRALEDRGNREDALEFYEKVFSLDINFEDVTERLRALR